MSKTSQQQAAARTARGARRGNRAHPDGKIDPAARATRSCCGPLSNPATASSSRVDNQKQADFLAAALVKVDPAHLHGLHMVQSVLALPDHLAVFEAASRTGWTFHSPDPRAADSLRLVESGAVKIGAIHTYLELSVRTAGRPGAAGGAGGRATGLVRGGNLYTGPNTEDTPVIVEATALPRRHRGGAGQRDRRPVARGSISPAAGSTSYCKGRRPT